MIRLGCHARLLRWAAWLLDLHLRLLDFLVTSFGFLGRLLGLAPTRLIENSEMVIRLYGHLRRLLGI